jgi:hypothetical protein
LAFCHAREERPTTTTTTNKGGTESNVTNSKAITQTQTEKERAMKQASTGNATKVGDSVGSEEPDISEVTITIGKHTHTFTPLDFRNLLMTTQANAYRATRHLEPAVETMIKHTAELGLKKEGE